MSKIEEAAAVIRQLQAALSLHVSMVASGEMATNRSTSIKLDAQLRANQWLDSIELPKQVREWPQYMQRVWVEKQELDERAKKCSEFIGHSPIFEKLPLIDQELLKEQNDIMWQLSEVLGKRIERFFEPPPDDMVDQLSEPPVITKENSQWFYDMRKAQLNQAKGSPKLFNVQDSERPAFVIAHSFEEALQKWKVAVAEENATDSEYEEVPPAGVMHVCDADELIIDRGFADKANS